MDMARKNTQALIWFGQNEANQSRFSSKVYLIGVRGADLYARWGSADLRGRKVQPRWLQSRSWRYPTNAAAIAALKDIVDSKLVKGYERAPRGVATGLTALL